MRVTRSLNFAYLLIISGHLTSITRLAFLSGEWILTGSNIKLQAVNTLLELLIPSQRFLRIGTLALCASAASAGVMGPVTTSSAFNGFYLGGSVGGSFSTGTLNTTSLTDINFPATIVGGQDNTTSPTFLQTNLKNNSAIGDFYAGYGMDYHRAYVGLEAFVTVSNYRMKNSGSFSTTQFFSIANRTYIVDNNWQTTNNISRFQYGLDLRPGFVLNPLMLLYGRVGFAVAKLTQSANLTGTVVYSALGAPNNFPFVLNQSATNNKIALRLGGGFECYINPTWSLRMDYIYVGYGSLDSANSLVNTVSGARVNTGTLRVNNTINLRSIYTNTVMIGISHYFS